MVAFRGLLRSDSEVIVRLKEILGESGVIWRPSDIEPLVRTSIPYGHQPAVLAFPTTTGLGLTGVANKYRKKLGVRFAYCVLRGWDHYGT